MTEKKVEEKEGSRREFIKGTVMGGVAGAVLGAVAGGVTGSTLAPPGPPGAQGPPGPPGAVEEQKWDADILVVGCGEGGMFASISAADLGAKVILLEKMPDVQGSASWISGGTISGACTRMQLEQGITNDSPWEHFKDAMRIGKYVQEADLLKVFVENAGAVVDWLDEIGVPFKDHKALFAPAHELYTIQRSYWPDPQPPLTSGGVIATYVNKELEKRIARGDVKRYFENRAKALIKDDSGRIIGLKADDKDGKEVQYLAKATILATGGFMSGKQARHDFAPSQEFVISGGAVSSTGDGLYMATAVGAKVTNMDLQYSVPSPGAIQDPNDPLKSRGSVVTNQYPGPIWVNKNAERFIDEGTTYELGRQEACASQPESLVFVILDEGIKTGNKDAPIAFGDWAKFDAAATEGVLVKKADTIKELAGKLGLDVETLVETITNYNGYVTAGKDPDFGRKELKYKIEKPPFYGIKTVPSSLAIRGGLKVSKFCEVLDTNEKVIPGLYAAGEVVSLAITCTGRAAVSGSYNITAMTYGRKAGEEAYRYAQAIYNK